MQNRYWLSLRALTWLEKLGTCHQISNELYDDVLHYTLSSKKNYGIINLIFFLRFSLPGFDSGEKIIDKNFWSVLILVGEKYQSPLKNCLLSNGFFFTDKVDSFSFRQIDPFHHKTLISSANKFCSSISLLKSPKISTILYVEECQFKKSFNAFRWFPIYFCGDCFCGDLATTTQVITQSLRRFNWFCFCFT